MVSRKVLYYILFTLSSLLLVVGIIIGNNVLNTMGFISIILIFIFSKIIKNKTINGQVNTITLKDKSIKKRTSLEKLKYFENYMENWLQDDFTNFLEEYNCYSNNCCPICGFYLNCDIKSSKRCPGCNGKIILRTNKLNSKKFLLSEKRANDYDKHDKIRSEIIYFDNLIFQGEDVYKNYMSKFYELKSAAQNPRDVVYPFVNYVGCQLDNIAFRKYMEIINLPEQDMVLESFEVIRQFNLANMQFFRLARIADYKGRRDVALDSYATAVYRGIQIFILDNIVNPFYKFKTIDIVGNIFPGEVIKFLERNNYTYEDFKINFINNKHPFILQQLSNKESWNYVNDAFKLYRKMDAERNIYHNI